MFFYNSYIIVYYSYILYNQLCNYTNIDISFGIRLCFELMFHVFSYEKYIVSIITNINYYVMMLVIYIKNENQFMQISLSILKFSLEE